MKLEWTQEALNDIDNIFQYIAEDNLERAITFSDELFNYPERLKKNPFLGVRFSENNSVNIRLLIYKSYNIIYEVDVKNDTIIILVVYQHSRKPKLKR